MIKLIKRETHSHGQFLDIDLISQNSKLKDVSAVLKCIVATAVLIMVMVENNILFSAITAMTMAFITIKIGGVSASTYIKLMLMPITFIVLGTVAIAISISKTKVGVINLPLFSYFICVTKNGLLEALRVSVKALGMVSSLYMLSLSTPMYEIIEVLKKCRLPKVVIELMFLIYRYIFILLKMQAQMHVSAESRLGYSGIRQSFFSFTHIGANLLAVSFKKAGDYFDAMVSRGYDGELIFLEEESKITLRQSIYVIAFLAFMAVIMVIIKLKGLGM
ncbi:MAG TPA: cobalt ECF transporter T component CbiQ [Lachnospiraceae bacterium]|nr:cobalt ECF transporter T component CbiQ [Lachnospiraceae bacterium]